MFLPIFLIALLAIILAVGGYLVWRSWRARDFQNPLDPRDEPGPGNSDATAKALSTRGSRMGGGFGS